MSGAIDASEWVGPYNDYFMKFYEAAKFYYYPGMHEPGSQLSLGINKSWWGKLSKTDQAIIEAACNEENARQMAETNANNGVYLTRLIKDHGVQLKKFNDEIYDSFGEASAAVFEETRQHSALAAKVHDSFVKAREDIEDINKRIKQIERSKALSGETKRRLLDQLNQRKGEIAERTVKATQRIKERVEP